MAAGEWWGDSARARAAREEWAGGGDGRWGEAEGQKVLGEGATAQIHLTVQLHLCTNRVLATRIPSSRVVLASTSGMTVDSDSRAQVGAGELSPRTLFPPTLYSWIFKSESRHSSNDSTLVVMFHVSLINVPTHTGTRTRARPCAGGSVDRSATRGATSTSGRATSPATPPGRATPFRAQCGAWARRSAAAGPRRASESAASGRLCRRAAPASSGSRL
jgi:hypothetical protein